jgi:hypothetical protein
MRGDLQPEEKSPGMVLFAMFSLMRPVALRSGRAHGKGELSPSLTRTISVDFGVSR